MTTNNNPNIVNQTPYLRTSRDFPEEAKQLSVELTRSYIDIAARVNDRIIGIYPTNRPAITGSSYYLSGQQRNQELRQVYTFTGTSAINLGFKITSMAQFSNCWGTWTDGTNIYGLVFGSSVAIAGQISFYIAATGSTTTDQITFVLGAGAPSLTSGMIVISWLSNP